MAHSERALAANDDVQWPQLRLLLALTVACSTVIECVCVFVYHKHKCPMCAHRTFNAAAFDLTANMILSQSAYH